MKPVTILVPAAGSGSRFAKAGYDRPKPFILVEGRPMIRFALDNLSYPRARYHAILQKSHVEAFRPELQALTADPAVTVSTVDGLTEGTACTVLTARDRIDLDAPLLIANCDQYVEGGVAAMLDDAVARELDGSIMVFPREDDPKWSYARLDGELVVEVAEKKPISNLATVGIYYFRSGHAFVEAAEAMIAQDDRVNGEFYTCPVYNHLIAGGGKVGIFRIEADAMHGLGVPGDLDAFSARRASERPD